MALVAGVDSSTQSCKVLVVDAETGAVRGRGAAVHPDVTEVDPGVWWEALQQAVAEAGGWDRIEAVSVAAQQHGLVAVDATGAVVRPALLWNDMRGGDEARSLVEEYGPTAWAKAVGSVPVPSFTVTKLAWLAAHETESAERVTQVMLPHDWLTRRLLDRDGEAVTDRSDASGTGYWSPAENAYRPDLLERAFGRPVGTPRVLGPREPAGRTGSGVLVGPGAGDNAAAALGLSAEPGDVIVSVGTSGTVFAVADHATSDASGAVAGFADAVGRFLPLVCTLSATRVLAATAELLAVDHNGFDRLAADAPPDAGRLVFVPYLDGERTPNLPDASGTLLGLRRTTMTPAHLARAAVLGVLCGLADGLDELRRNGVTTRRVLLIGGGARSEVLREAAAGVFGLPVSVPEPAEYVALGAAKQAAWVLSGSDQPPGWALHGTSQYAPSGDWGARVRARYREARDRVYGHATT